jgi:quinolinate synthase
MKIVQSFPVEQPLIFAPDKNLGAYVNKMTGRNMVLWNGTCEVHDIINTEAVINMKLAHPDAKLIAHPECKAVILAMADYIGSTTGLLNYTMKDPSKKFIVATETGIIYQMKKSSPEKEFLIVPTDETCSCNDCPYMKLNTLPKLLRCLETETPQIILTQELIDKAKQPILRMLKLSE